MTECPRHPGAESVGTCERCGRFYCAAERIALDLHFYCGECGVRDDIDWLGKHYQRFLGKPSGLSWFLLVVGLLMSVFGASWLFVSSTWSERLLYLAVLLLGVAKASIVTGKPWSRWAMAASLPVAALLFFGSSGEPWAVAAAFPSLLLTLSAFNDVPTQLFFRLPVTRTAMRRHYDRYGSNPLAMQASRLAVVSLFLPGVGAASLVMAVIALTRVNSKAVPPVGNLRVALGALVFSLFTSFIWLSAFFGNFAPHFDGAFVRSPNERSLLTFMVYLNECEAGGHTGFSDLASSRCAPAPAALCSSITGCATKGPPCTRGSSTRCAPT